MAKFVVSPGQWYLSSLMATRSDQNQPTSSGNHRKKEIGGVLLLACAIFLLLGLGSGFWAEENWMGPAGFYLSKTIYYFLGISSFLLVYAIVWSAIRCLRPRANPLRFGSLAGAIGMGFCFVMLLHLLFPVKTTSHEVDLFHKPLKDLSVSGLFGDYGAELARSLLGTVGTVLLCITGLLVCGLVITSLSYQETWKKCLQRFQTKLTGFRKKTAREKAEPVQNEDKKPLPKESALSTKKSMPLVEEPLDAPTIQILAKQPLSQASQEEPKPTPSLETHLEGPKVLPRAITQPLEKPGDDYIKTGTGDYQLPSLEILEYKEKGHAELDRKAMLELAQRLEKSLADYQVKGRVSQIHPGPVVTMYEFVPSPGTKLSRITALSSDLAMALEALRVRIVAPIPGKAAVGIEVPNAERETVYLKETLAHESFAQAKSKLTMALGKDIVGTPVSVDLAKMPHLLIAGTTGSGKSVAVNVMICSMLFRASPEEVKLIMIDPKMIELSIYEGIPHLLLPVVTSPQKANLALKWAVDEMERRYDLISKAGVRDLAGYNRKAEELLAGTLSAAQSNEFLDSTEASDSLEEPEELAATDASSHQPPRKLPYIVVIIDEFADLMMVSSKEVEASVARIAQKARAAGIHLILATQRPSVDVITGLIKANFPSRIAFQVASRIDSRTILDTQGAEALLGMGDMLFTDRGQALRRIHGALITDAEVHRMVEQLKTQGKPIYNMDILKPRDEENGDEAGADDEFADEMYDQGVRLVTESRQASISMIQRRLRIGYNRAARMMERMEREGIVSMADGAKGREVLVPPI